MPSGASAEQRWLLCSDEFHDEMLVVEEWDDGTVDFEGCGVRKTLAPP